MTTETKIQQSLVKKIDEWFGWRYPGLMLNLVDSKKRPYKVSPLFAVPNEGKRGIRTAQRMKAEGLRSGVPDLVIPISNDKYNGLFIEMKKPKGVTSKNQKEWIRMLVLLGYNAIVCNSTELARLAISEHMETASYTDRTGAE